MNSITVSKNKTLKLTNALIYEVNLKEETDLNSIVLKMENYIKSKGALPIGPLIQKMSYSLNEEGNVDLHIYMIRQVNSFIHNVESPYKIESILRVCNCMYAHYIGPEDKINYAYDKINVTAFEEDIDLSKENYTIFVSNDDENIIADIFVETLHHE